MDGSSCYYTAGDTHASRVGVSLLSNVGLSEFIARTQDEYVSTAVNLANDIKKLQKIRKALRDQMIKSPLMCAERFTLNLEKSYSRMWEEYCKTS